MFEDESQAQLAELTGTPVRFCDVCGKPVTGTHVITRGRGASPAMAERLLRVCDDCYAEIEGGELAVTDEGAETIGSEFEA
jgi:ribosome-binding protein aMBF1 (putative translation factor)